MGYKRTRVAEEWFHASRSTDYSIFSMLGLINRSCWRASMFSSKKGINFLAHLLLSLMCMAYLACFFSQSQAFIASFIHSISRAIPFVILCFLSEVLADLSLRRFRFLASIFGDKKSSIFGSVCSLVVTPLFISIGMTFSEVLLSSHIKSVASAPTQLMYFLFVFYFGAAMWFRLIQRYYRASRFKGNDKDSIYWYAQTGGWGFVAIQWVLLVSASNTSGIAMADIASWSVIIATASLAVSHFVIRPYLLALWGGTQNRALLLFKILGITVVALILMIYIEFLWVAFKPPTAHSSSPQVVFMLTLMKYVPLLIWVAIYTLYIVWRARRESLEKQLILESELNRTRLKALKQQLNPHFLFNTLNSLRSMILKDKNSARAIVSDLSNLLRFSLYLSEHDRVLLKDELENCHAYLNLQKVRYQEKLYVTWKIDQQFDNSEVLPLSIQTLLENAIKYGLSDSQRILSVEVRIYEQANKLIIEVRNSGAIDKNTNKATSQDGGLGLASIKERLQLAFSDSASFSLNQDDDWVSAKIIQPLEWQGPKDGECIP